MMALIRWIASLVIATTAILFAVGNREAVTVTWSPVHDPFVLPLFVPVLGAAATGFVIGGFVVWLNAAASRREKRRQRHRIRDLEKEIEDIRQPESMVATTGIKKGLLT